MPCRRRQCGGTDRGADLPDRLCRRIGLRYLLAAEAPGEDAFTVQQAVDKLGGEYRDYLQQIESTMPHDRQEIKANDDVYYIRWQDVLAVFFSYVSGARTGAPVAYLDESRLQQLRQTMWDMNEVAYSTYTETVETKRTNQPAMKTRDSGDSSKNPGEDIATQKAATEPNPLPPKPSHRRCC